MKGFVEESTKKSKKHGKKFKHLKKVSFSLNALKNKKYNLRAYISTHTHTLIFDT